MIFQYHIGRISPSAAVYVHAGLSFSAYCSLDVLSVGIPFNSTSSMDVHGVSLTTASSVIVQGTSFNHCSVTVQPITCSFDVQGVAKCYINAGKLDCWESISIVPEWTYMLMPEPVSYLNKGTQYGTGMLRYWTETASNDLTEILLSWYMGYNFQYAC